MRKWGNCLTWALPRWLCRYMQGEALVIRRSTFTWVPHFMRATCIHGLEVDELVPERHPAKNALRLFPIQSIIFRGVERRGEAVCMCEDCRDERGE